MSDKCSDAFNKYWDANTQDYKYHHDRFEQSIGWQECWNIRAPATMPTVEELQDMIGRAQRSWAEQDSYPTPFGFAKSFNEHLALYVHAELARRMGGESTSEKHAEPRKGGDHGAV